MHWGIDSPTPEALLERVGLGTCTHRTHTSVQGLSASQYFPLFYLKLELLFCLFDKSNAMIQYRFPSLLLFIPVHGFGHFL